MGRSKIKAFPQPDDISCGPATLKTTLRIFGIHKPFSEINRLCKTNKNGTSLPNFIRAARQLGISVLSKEWATLTHLKSSLKNQPGFFRAVVVDYLYQDKEPYEETGHYAVVAGFSTKKNRITIFDSSTGSKKSYSWKDFLSRWYDYDFRRIKNKKSDRHHMLYKKWHVRPLIVLAKHESHLPKFKNSFSL